MTHRRKSSCCCDAEQGPCFLGFGTVPKTIYDRSQFISCPNDGTISKPTDEWRRNPHDNWSFCDPKKEEELVLFIQRDPYSWDSYCTVSTPYPCIDDVNCPWDNAPEGTSPCDRGCRIDPFSISSRADGADPIVVRYRHPVSENDAYYGEKRVNPPVGGFGQDWTGVPDRAANELYAYSFVHAERSGHAGNLYPFEFGYQVQQAAGGREPRIHDYGENGHGFPCYCHEFGNGGDGPGGNCDDWLCSQGNFSRCKRDPNVDYGFDFNGINQRPCTKGQANAIGDTWRTADYGWVRSGDHNFGCDSILGPAEMGGKYFWLQGIANAPTDHFYNHYMADFTIDPNSGCRQYESYVLDYGYGPEGTRRLADTLLVVVHREKYYERYYTSINEDDNPTQVPEGYSQYLPSEDHLWPTSSGTFFSQRTPEYFVLGCAGCPIFSWEIAFNDYLENTNWEDVPELVNDYREILDALCGDIPIGEKIITIADLCFAIFSKCLTLYDEQLNIPKDVGYLSNSLAKILEDEGILPSAQNYGPEQDFKIFKKTMKRIDVSYDGKLGMCCFSGDVTSDDCLEENEIGGCAIPTCGQAVDTDGDGALELRGVVCEDPSYVECCLKAGVSYKVQFDPALGKNEYTECPEDQQPGCAGYNDTVGTGWDELCIELAEAYVTGSIANPGECERTITACMDGLPEDMCKWYGGAWHEGKNCEIHAAQGYCEGDTPEDKDGKQKGSCCKRCSSGGGGAGGIGGDSESADCYDGDNSVLCRCHESTFVANSAGDDIDLEATCIGKPVGDEDGDLSDCVDGSDSCYLWRPNRNCWNINGIENCGPDPLGAECESRPSDFTLPDEIEDISCTNPLIICEEQYFYGRPGGWSHSCSSATNRFDKKYFPQRMTRFSGNCFSAAPYPQVQNCESDMGGGCGQYVCDWEDQNDLMECLRQNCCINNTACAICGSGIDNNDNPEDYWCSDETLTETCRGAWFQYQMNVLEPPTDNCTRNYRCAITNNAWLLRVDPWLTYDASKGVDAPEEDQVEIWTGHPGWIPTRNYDDDPYVHDEDISWYHPPLTIGKPRPCTLATGDNPDDPSCKDVCCHAQCTIKVFNPITGYETVCPNIAGHEDSESTLPEAIAECEFNHLLSDGDGDIDPACGRLCPKGYYCCSYTGQCLEYGVHPCRPCPQECPEGENCCVVLNEGEGGSYEIRCVSGECPQHDEPDNQPPSQQNISFLNANEICLEPPPDCQVEIPQTLNFQSEDE